MDDIIIPSNLLHQILEQLTDNSVQADEPVNLVHRQTLNSIQFRRKTKPLKPIFNKPYPLIIDFEPNLELLKNQIYNDFRSLSSMEEDFLIFPSDVNAEGSDILMIEASEQMALDKGKKIMDSEPPAYVLKLQEDFDSQKVKHEALEVKFDNMAETQKVMQSKQDTMDSKLDTTLALLSKKP
ncbi:hypothetical protein A2U01_0031963 [Trifolium medium]|uniref:Uncharacterized protein n=1 Tax=Trifolium medium TaxID=97028 RepID=A0A392PHT4_9FABA|nr:hypothetical protein [Trifolium medium]